jgi:hypothetical protein
MSTKKKPAEAGGGLPLTRVAKDPSISAPKSAAGSGAALAKSLGRTGSARAASFHRESSPMEEGNADQAELAEVGAALIRQVADLNQAPGADADFRANSRAVLDGFACMLPIREARVNVLDRSLRAGARQLVGVFSQSITPFTTEPFYDMNVADFGRMFGIARCTPETKAQFLNCLELLLKEAIIRKINITEAVVQSMIQLIWNNSLPRFGVSLVGTYISIIFARDSLLLFSNTILGAISLNHLSLDHLTALSGYVYYNCTLENLNNFLVYRGVEPANAIIYLNAVQNYTITQIQYIVMATFLLSLQYFGGQRVLRHDIQALFAIFSSSPPINHIGQVPAAPADPLAAQAALQQGIQAAADAAGGAAAAALPAPPQLGVGRLDRQGLINAGNLLKEGITFAFVRGFRFTRDNIANVFTIYAARGPAGQGGFVNINALLQTVSNWGGQLIEARANFLQPGNPNTEINQLISALMGITIDADTRPEELGLKIYTFSENIKNEMLAILRAQLTTRYVARVQREWLFLSLDCVTSLMQRFGSDNIAGGGGLNMGRFSQFCQVMPLFSSTLTAETLRQLSPTTDPIPDPIPDSLEVLAGMGSRSLEQMDVVILTPDSIANAYLTSAKMIFQAFGQMIDRGLNGMAVAAGSQGGNGVPAQEVFQRMQALSELENRGDIMAGVTDYLQSQIGVGDIPLTPEQCNTIITSLEPFVERIDTNRLFQYIVNLDPNQAVPTTLLEIVNSFLEVQFRGPLIRYKNKARTALISGVNRHTASLCDLTSRSTAYVCVRANTAGNRVSTFVRGCIHRIKNVFGAAPLAPAAVADDAGALRAALAADAEAAAAAPEAMARLDFHVGVGVRPAAEAAAAERAADAVIDVRDNPFALVQVMNQALDVVAPPIVQVDSMGDQSEEDEGHDGGKSRSRKRSASKRTRRTSAAKKQKSKKNKRQSRRKARRSSSRNGRK